MDQQHAEAFLEGVPADPDPIRDLYAAVARGDYEAAAQYLTEDVALQIDDVATIQFHGRGRRQVIDAIIRNFALVVEQRPEIESIIQQGNQVAVLLRDTIAFRGEGRAKRMRGVHWFTLSHGQVSRIDQVVAELS